MKLIIKEDEYVDQVNYNDCSFSVYRNDDCFYTIVAGKPVFICKTEENYKTCLKDIIDIHTNKLKKLGKDTYLVWFDNAGHRDIKLIKDNRILKVFLVIDEIKAISKPNMVRMIKESNKILDKIKEI